MFMARKKAANTPMSNRMKYRLNIIVSLLLLAFVCYILINLIGLSVVHSDEYKAKAAEQQAKSLTINSNRGTIYDANMEVLASSATVWNVIVSPNSIEEEDKAQVASDLAAILEMDANEVLEHLQKDNMYEIVKKKVEKPVADQIRALITDENKDYYFITLEEDTKRYYPQSTLAAQVIGFTNSENTGVYGVEASYDDVLQGTPGKVLTAVDANGNNIPTSYEKQYDAQDENSIVLTIDSTIQHYVEQALADVTAQFNPLNGAYAIVMDVNTGAILAMGNSITYDLNNPSELYSPLLQWKLQNPREYKYDATAEKGEWVNLQFDEKEMQEWENTLIQTQWNNSCINATYSPGSVFKIVTGTAALEEGVIGFDTFSYDCHGYIEVEDRTIKCHVGIPGHGVQSFTQAVVNSCNPAFISIGQSMGIHTFNRYLDAYGITEKTGIDLFGEQQGVYIPEDQMTLVDLASESFGQTLTVTPLQMITAAAAVANGGYLVQPYVVAEVQDSDGNVISTTQTNVKRQVISEQVSQDMLSAMEAMVSANGGSAAYIQGYRIAGKSGTTQVNNWAGTGRYVGSFLAVAPADDPQIAVLVVVNEPQGEQYYGSQVAGPALRSILANTLPYLGIGTEYSDEDAQNLEPTVPTLLNHTVEEAKAELAGLGTSGLTAEVIGSGDTVVDQMPKGGVSVADGSKVILYTDTSDAVMATVPNVVGKSVAEAEAEIKAAGFNISFKGSAVTSNYSITVDSQSIDAGTQQPVGTVISITYSNVVADG